MKQEAAPAALLFTEKFSKLLGQLSPKKQETASSSVSTAQTRVEEPGSGKHSDKWDRCVKDVKKKGSADNAYAVCTSQLESSKKPSKEKTSSLNFLGKLKEAKEMAGAQPEGKRFRVTLLQEGLGNLGDCFYYTPLSIQSAVPLFEGRQFFINHPAASEEQDRPERDVRDIAGYFENCAAEMREDGVTCLMGDLVLLTGPSFDQIRTLMMESLAYDLKHPGSNLVGLSINASGDFETVGIEAYLNDGNVPEACKPKLVEALSKGITMIRPVQEIESAVSCDLVTTAGAGGMINRLLEGGKMPKKEEGKKEEGKKESSKQEAGHDDEAQDKDLIMDMLKKYLGDGFSDEDKAMAKEAYSHAMEMCKGDGMDDEMAHKEAMDIAGKHMKMARHMQKKEMEKAGDPDSDASAAAAHEPPGQMGDEKPAHRESAKPAETDSATIVKLSGENAALRAEVESLKLEKHIDAKLKESRLPMSATKKLREAIKGVKTVKDFDEKLTLFKEAFSAGGEAGDTGFILGAEKTTGGTESKSGFGDCLDN